MTSPSVQPPQVPLERVLISVVQTWTMVDARGRLAAQVDPGTYRGLLGDAKNRYAAQRWERRTGNHLRDPEGEVPWSPGRNNFWSFQLTEEYENRAPFDLVEHLVPLRFDEPADGVVVPTGLTYECFRHPFGWTTVLHAKLPLRSPQGTAAQLAADITTLLRTPLGPDRQFRNGVPRTWFDPNGRVGSLRPGPAALLLSGLRREGSEPLETTQRLAELYGPPTSATASTTRTLDAAMCVAPPVAAHTWPAREGVRTTRPMLCHHQNLSLLLALTESWLGAVRATADSDNTTWYQRRAAVELTRLSTGRGTLAEPSAYRSRLAPEWISASGLVDRINALAAEVPDGPPPIPSAP